MFKVTVTFSVTFSISKKAFKSTFQNKVKNTNKAPEEMLMIILTTSKMYKSQGWSKQTFKIKVEFAISRSQNNKRKVPNKSP